MASPSPEANEAYKRGECPRCGANLVKRPGAQKRSCASDVCRRKTYAARVASMRRNRQCLALIKSTPKEQDPVFQYMMSVGLDYFSKGEVEIAVAFSDAAKRYKRDGI